MSPDAPDRETEEFEDSWRISTPFFDIPVTKQVLLSDPDWRDWFDKVGIFQDQMKTECRWADQDLSSLGSGMVRTDA